MTKKNKERSICVIGAGRWGRNHVKTLHALGALGGVVDLSEEILREVASTYHVPTFHSVQEAMARGFDGWIVATPAEKHEITAHPLIDAGQNILIEKPLALSKVDCKMIIAQAMRHNANAMVGHVMLFHPAIQKIRELLQENALGKVYYIESNRLNLGTFRLKEDVFWSLAPHDISILEYLIDHPATVRHATGCSYLQPSHCDDGRVTLKLGNGVDGHIHVSWLYPVKEHRLSIVGNKGMIVYEDSSENKEIRLFHKGYKRRRGEFEKFDEGMEVIPYEKTPPLTAELQYFIDHLDDHYALADLMNGLSVVNVLEQIDEKRRKK